MDFGFIIPSTVRDSKNVDVVIIGAGPAGLSSGIYAVRAGLSTTIVDKGNAGGFAGEAPFVENYLGFDEINGEELAKRFKKHAMKYAEISERNAVIDIKKEGDTFFVKSEKGDYNAKAIIFATGTTHKELGIEGERELYGRGVSYCATCDGYFFRGKKVAVVGGGNSGAIAAIYLKNIGAEPRIYGRKPGYACEAAYQKIIKEDNIPYIKNAHVIKITGEESVDGIVYRDMGTGEEHHDKVDGVFIYAGLVPQSGLARKIGVTTDSYGYIKVDINMRTNIPRIYAAGDITGKSGQIIISAGQGAIAAMSAYYDLARC